MNDFVVALIISQIWAVGVLASDRPISATICAVFAIVWTVFLLCQARE